MAVTTVGEVMRRSKLILQEVTKDGTRWTNEEILGWLNESYQAIVGLKPDARSVNNTVDCVAGTRQRIPDDGVMLLDVVRNLTTGTAVIRAARSALDATRRRWHSETETDEVEQFIFDESDPETFYVYPPAAAGVELEIIYSSVPAPHPVADASETSESKIRLADTYAPAMVDYILMRAYSKDAEHAASLNRAQLHSNSFATALGARLQNDVAFSPNAGEVRQQ